LETEEDTRLMFRTILLAFAGCLFSVVARGASGDAFSCRVTGEQRDQPVTVETTLAGVPAVVRIPKSVAAAPIVLWHGFGPPANAHALMEALPLDDVPAIKVYLDLPMFGARVPAGGVAELARRQTEDFASLLFEPVVVGAANELPAVVKALHAGGCMQPDDAIGLFGFSGGGAAALFALAERKVPMRSAVVLNASTGLNASIGALERATKKPYAWTAAARKLATRSDAILRAKDIASGHPPPALLIIQGADDSTLVPHDATALRDVLQSGYLQGSQQRLQLTLASGMSHQWSDAASIETVRQAASVWFTQYQVSTAATARK
jgi:predicted esterase